jgi:hypothetical protein
VGFYESVDELEYHPSIGWRIYKVLERIKNKKEKGLWAPLISKRILRNESQPKAEL